MLIIIQYVKMKTFIVHKPFLLVFNIDLLDRYADYNAVISIRINNLE